MNTVCEKDINIGCFLFLAKVCDEGGGGGGWGDGGWGVGGGGGVTYHQQISFEIITFKVF